MSSAASTAAIAQWSCTQPASQPASNLGRNVEETALATAEYGVSAARYSRLNKRRPASRYRHLMSTQYPGFAFGGLPVFTVE